MSNIIQKKQQQKLADDLNKKTHFQKSEIECLLKKFQELTMGKMDRATFRDLLHKEFDMTDDIIMDRVFKAFDKDNDSYISMEEWVKGLSTFLRGDLDEQIKFCFDVYDLNSDGYISREEMYHMLKTCLVKQTTDEDPDEGIKDMVELALKKLDDDNDHRVSPKDFEKAVKEEPLLLEAFGPCLPCAKDKDNDTRVSFSDFAEAVKEEPLLLQSVGPCLPSEQRIKAYQALFEQS